MGISGGSTKSEGSSYGYQQSLAQSMQNIWGAQANPLQQMFGDATGLSNRQQAQIGPAANRNLAAVMPAARAGLADMMQFANPNSDLVHRQTADLADTVGTEFGRTILPQLRSGAGIGGNMGGSREALSRGVAAGDAARAISSGATDFFSNAYNTAASSAAQLPGMAANVFNLGMAPFQAAWAPLTSLAGVLGSPTVLNRSQAMSQGENSSQQTSSGHQFGFNLW